MTGSGRRGGVVAVLALALAAVATAAPVWIRTAGTTVLAGEIPVEVTGMQAAPALPAVALVLLAAGAAIGLVGRVGRWAVAGVVAASGALLIAAALGVVADPDPVALRSVAELTGTATLAAAVTVTAAPYATATVGLAAVLVAAWLATTSRRWARPSRRHESAPEQLPGEPDDDRAAWDRLTAGEDPSDPSIR